MVGLSFLVGGVFGWLAACAVLGQKREPRLELPKGRK